MQLPMFIILFILMFEVIEFGQSAKFVRPYKFYNPHSRRPPRRYRTGPKHYEPEKISPQIYDEPYYRYAPHYKNWMSVPSDDKPYVIVIQLPKEKNELHSYQRRHRGELPGCARSDDYIDDDDNELKTYQLDNKRIHIKIDKRQSEVA